MNRGAFVKSYRYHILIVSEMRELGHRPRVLHQIVQPPMSGGEYLKSIPKSRIIGFPESKADRNGRLRHQYVELCPELQKVREDQQQQPIPLGFEQEQRDLTE